MKIPRNLFVELQTHLKRTLEEYPNFFKDYKNSGFSEMRTRWDLVYLSQYPVTKLYNYGLNDTHIDTALRLIVKKLTCEV